MQDDEVIAEDAQDPCEPGDEGREVYVARLEVTPGVDVVQFIAEVAVVPSDDHMGDEARQRDVEKPRGIAGERLAREEAWIGRTLGDGHAHGRDLSSDVNVPGVLSLLTLAVSNSLPALISYAPGG